MKNLTNLVVLISGCSTGIGRAMAEDFRRRGHRVFATARKVETLDALKGFGIETLPLDVTKAASISACVDAVIKNANRIDVLVNNAGFGLMGPIAEVDLDDVRRQFETNVVGALALAQAVVPHMVKQGGGRIVNVGSVSGVLTTPFAGPYCASKAAMHAVSDAMRVELAPLGIDVITLQPGGVESKFGDTATDSIKVKPDSLYNSMREFLNKRAQAGQVGAISAATFATRAIDAIVSEQPPAIFRLGPNSTKLPLFRWLLPTQMVDSIMSKKFGLNKLKKS